MTPEKAQEIHKELTEGMALEARIDCTGKGKDKTCRVWLKAGGFTLIFTTEQEFKQWQRDWMDKRHSGA